MVKRKVAIITLLQNVEQENVTDAELDKQIRQVIESSFLSRTWRVDHVALLDDAKVDQENVES